MFRSLTRSAGVALAITVIGASSAAAVPADLRTPDAVDAGRPAVVTSTQTDLRTPDAKDSSSPATSAAGRDLRTPDVVDYGQGRGTFSAPEVTVVKVTEPPVVTAFDWGDAGIGAAGLLGVVLIALGGMLAITHRRHGRAPLAG